MKYSLAIAHRVCPALSKTAALFDDKYEVVTDYGFAPEESTIFASDLMQKSVVHIVQ